MTAHVEVQHVTRRYHDAVAVSDVSFSLHENVIHGLLGRNGAGKTTLMRIVAGQETRSEGTVLVAGRDPFEDAAVQRSLCFIKESQAYADVRVDDALTAARLVRPHWDETFARSLLADFDLPPRRRVRKLSRGMRSALGVVIGLASRAPLTMFDEPYLGLDAPSRQLFYDRLLDDYARHPRTVVLSTHLIDEVSALLERVIVVDKGRIVADGDVDELRVGVATVSGPAADVARFTAGRRVLDSEQIGSFTRATVAGPLSAAERDDVVELGLDLAPVSLQQWVVHMTGLEAGAAPGAGMPYAPAPSDGTGTTGNHTDSTDTWSGAHR